MVDRLNIEGDAWQLLPVCRALILWLSAVGLGDAKQLFPGVLPKVLH